MLQVQAEVPTPTHISAPVLSQSELIKQKTLARRRGLQVDSDHIFKPLLSQSELSQQRKRRRVEARWSPSQSLVDAYLKRKDATAGFPPNLTAKDIRTAMRRYEQIVEDACAAVETSCASCGEFAAKAELGSIPVDDERLRSTRFPERVFLLDNCGMANGSYQICQTCLNAFNGGRIPKFSALNAVNVTMCQSYPAELEDLTLMEEYTIAMSDPIGAILKLKPNGKRSKA
jgi:hypothetical protein